MEESLVLKSSQKFEYLVNESKYETEEALHSADAATCVAEDHEWKKSFVYGRYSCKKCDATRMKIN
jgi:hypothetical protein